MSEDTKNKILSTAGRLFAQNGFERTSIRDISKEAEVNLASVNYHFKNKQNLFSEVMEASLNEIETHIDNIAQNTSCVKDFSSTLYHHLVNNDEIFKNSFKLFITDNLPIDQDTLPESCKQDFNPPGFTPMLALITREVGKDIPLAGREWAVRAIFSYIVHSALVMCSSLAKMLENKVPHLGESEKKRSIENLADSVINFLRDHPEQFN